MNTQAPAKIEASTPIEGFGNGGMLAPRNMGDVVEFSKLMCKAGPAIRKHFRDNPGACMAVTLQALRWEMDPFQVANKSYFVNDQLAFESQLIAAVINTRAPLSKRPAISYSGDGDTRQCHIEMAFKDGTVQQYDSPPFASITPKNSPLWKSDPDQQLAYYSLRSAARRYCPEVILGAMDRDEVEGAEPMMRNITPEKHGYAARLEHAKGEAEGQTFQGFDADHVDHEIDTALAGATGTQDDEMPAEATEKPADAPNEHDSTTSTGGNERNSVDTDLLEGLKQGFAACQTEEEVLELGNGYSAQINEASPETKRQAKLLRAERLKQIAEAGE